MNQIPLSQDDPRLTAYAFEEMTPAERTEFEQLLQRDPAAQRAVAEIRAAGLMLEAVLEHEPVTPVAFAPAKTAAKNARILRFPQFYYMVSGMAAACFAIFFVYWQTNKPLHEKSRQYVKMETGDEVDEKGTSANGGAVALPAAPAAVTLADSAASGLAMPAEREPVDLNDAFAKKSDDGLALTAKEQAGKLKDEVMKQRRSLPVGVLAADAGRAAFGSNQVTKPKSLAALTAARAEQRAAGYFAGTVTGYAMPMPSPSVRQKLDKDLNTEGYGYRKDNAFLGVRENPLSTFSIDVDTASYANMRRFLTQGQLPPADAVRIEELVNYFPYRYTPPTGEVPFSANLEVASAPWSPEHRLVRIGLKGREVSDAARPAANLVFLLDVSGSMMQPNKLPLVKQSLRLLVDKLRADDHVAIAVYAGASGLALPSTPVSHKAEIIEAIEQLQAGGSTNGAMGIQLAYDIAKANFISGGVNRVILATDGDFNIGVTNDGALVRLVEEKAKSGVFLSVLGFGMGNLKDSTMEQLADKGNGNYAYIDTIAEARKTLVEQAGGTLMTIAKDVKIQVEFNPAEVQAYRLIGYENRLLAKEDFNNDKIDAGEIGAGHTVTALYEVVPAGAEMPATGAVDALKYQRTEDRGQMTGKTGELLTVSIRYKEPSAEVSRKLQFPLRDGGADFENASEDFKFAAAVASFGMVLRESPYKGSATLADIAGWGRQGLSNDAGGYRSEFLGLVQKAQGLVQ